MSIYSKLHAIQKAIKPVGKNGHNSFHKYNYVTKTDVLAEINPLCNEHGVYHSVSVTESDIGTNDARVKVELMLVDAESGDKHIVYAEGYAADKSGDKAVYKAMTGASKYAYLQAFGLATDDDPENEKGEPPIQTKRVSQKEVDKKAAALKEEQQAIASHLRSINTYINDYGLTKQDVQEITGLDTLQGLDSNALSMALDAILVYVESQQLRRA